MNYICTYSVCDNPSGRAV